MVNLEQLKQLITFAEEGTITKAKKKLLISQPALTRSLQRLELELDVQLFERKKNKITLTETGLYTVKQALQLLEHANSFLADIHHQARKNTQIFIGVSAPGPIFELKDLAREVRLEKQLNFEIKSHGDLVAGLLNGTYQIIITEQQLNMENILSKSFLMEQLLITVPNKHILSQREELTLSDLKGLSMLVFTNLGTWNNLIANLTETNFIKQTDEDTFNNLVQASDLPHFTTNLTELYCNRHPHHISIPIVNPEATKTFYINVLCKNATFLKEFKLYEK